MEQWRSAKTRTFAWQASLVLLPLLGLTVFGIVSLQQDRRLARAAAVERAQGLAETMVPLVWGEIEHTAADTAVLFEVDASGKLVRPEPMPAIEDLAGAGEQPANSSANDLFRAGLAFVENKEWQQAANTFARVANEGSNARGETGLPLAPLAEFKYLQVAQESSLGPGNSGITLESFCSNLVVHPNSLSPLLLEKAEALAEGPAELTAVREWQARLHDQERAWSIFDLASGRAGNLWAAPKIVPLDDTSFLFGMAATGSNRSFLVLSKHDLGLRIKPILNREVSLPSYFGMRVEVGGSPLDVFGLPEKVSSQALPSQAKLTPEKGAILASATKREEGEDLLKVNVRLIDPAGLYARQNARTWWLGGFIAVSVCAALIGLSGAWRAFRRQEALNAMKSNFVSSVSHELRAPIASVRLMAENLERGKVQEEPRRQEYFRFIGQECRRLSSLVENVLNFSRIEQGRRQYEFEPCDLSAIVENTVQIMRLAAEERGVRLEWTGLNTASPVSVRADGEALQQALINLVDNAIKHSPRGAVVMLGVETTPDLECVRVWVEDQGEGIPHDQHVKIFDRFYRLGPELRRETQGVGIGLSIVKHVVEAHGGKIHLRSAPGEGSRFTIELPGKTPERS